LPDGNHEFPFNPTSDSKYAELGSQPGDWFKPNLIVYGLNGCMCGGYAAQYELEAEMESSASGWDHRDSVSI